MEYFKNVVLSLIFIYLLTGLIRFLILNLIVFCLQILGILLAINFFKIYLVKITYF